MLMGIEFHQRDYWENDVICQIVHKIIVYNKTRLAKRFCASFSLNIYSPTSQIKYLWKLFFSSAVGLALWEDITATDSFAAGVADAERFYDFLGPFQALIQLSNAGTIQGSSAFALSFLG